VIVVAVVGPTATGKSDLALDLAEALSSAQAPAEIVNADAYQLYRGMDVGTAKVPEGERRGIVHHQVDVLDPHEDASVARYQSAAAASIGPFNTRRIVRALEVIAITGRPFTANLPRQEYVRPAVQIGLDCDRAALDDRVTRRVERMWDQGLLEEVRGLAAPEQGGTGPGLGATAARAVGYAEVVEHLLGRQPAEAAREAITANTRRLARKQMGWFGRDPRVQWLDAAAPDLLERALAVVTAADAGTLADAGEEPVRRPLGL